MIPHPPAPATRAPAAPAEESASRSDPGSCTTSWLHITRTLLKAQPPSCTCNRPSRCIIAIANQEDPMNRRHFLGALAGSAFLPGATRAQKSAYLQLPELTAHGVLV